jgi:hypothetical protein
MKTIGKSWGSEGIHAGAVLVLSGVLVLVITKGDGTVSLKKVVRGCLSNPVPCLDPRHQ